MAITRKQKLKNKPTPSTGGDVEKVLFLCNDGGVQMVAIMEHSMVVPQK